MSRPRVASLTTRLRKLVLMGPGCTTETEMPAGPSSTRRPSPMASTANLLAE